MRLLKSRASATPAMSIAASSQEFSEIGHLRNSLKRKRLAIGVFILFALILIQRSPEALFPGRFWAEDGSVFFLYAWTHPFWDALTASHMGYFSIVPNLAGILAAHVPLEWSPRIPTAIGLIIETIPAALILFTRIPGPTQPMYKAVALLVLLVVPSNPEVFMNAANAHFLLCAATGLILISEPGGKIGRWLKWILLVVAGLTGVVSTFLTPFFWWQWWQERNRERLVQAMILTACATLQFLFITHALGSHERELHNNATLMIGVVHARFFAAALLSNKALFHYVRHFAPQLMAQGTLPIWVWLMTIAGMAFFLSLCLRSRNRAAILLAFASLWVTLLSVTGALTSPSADSLYQLISEGMRYYYAPQAFFFLAVMLSRQPASAAPRWMKILGSVWLVLTIGVGLYNFHNAQVFWKKDFHGPAWTDELREWRENPATCLGIWPDGCLHLPPKR